MPGIDFFRELPRGLAAYEDSLGSWWLGRACNGPHLRAYRRIAEFMRASVRTEPALILDYACGPGHLLGCLGRHFRRSALVGLDGSALMLERARRRLGRSGSAVLERTRLIRTPLPNFELHGLEADLLVFAFPNMVPSCVDKPEDRPLHRMPRRDRRIAEEIARLGRLAPAPDEENPEGVGLLLLKERLLSLNFRRLLRRGGLCVRVEYGSVRRQELSRPELLRVAFEEGSLESRVGGLTPKAWFRVVASAYLRSSVIEDVFHQSGDADDRRGGYLITVLRAL